MKPICNFTSIDLLLNNSARSLKKDVIKIIEKESTYFISFQSVFLQTQMARICK